MSTNVGETAVCAMSGGDVSDTDQRLQSSSMFARSNFTCGIFPKTLSGRRQCQCEAHTHAAGIYQDKDTRTPETLSRHRQHQRKTAGVYQDKDTRTPQTL